MDGRTTFPAACKFGHRWVLFHNFSPPEHCDKENHQSNALSNCPTSLQLQQKVLHAEEGLKEMRVKHENWVKAFKNESKSIHDSMSELQSATTKTVCAIFEKFYLNLTKQELENISQSFATKRHQKIITEQAVKSVTDASISALISPSNVPNHASSSAGTQNASTHRTGISPTTHPNSTQSSATFATHTTHQ